MLLKGSWPSKAADLLQFSDLKRSVCALKSLLRDPKVSIGNIQKNYLLSIRKIDSNFSNTQLFLVEVFQYLNDF